MRIVQVANYVTPSSGGIRTALDQLGRGYRARGHEVCLLVPGRRDRVRSTPAGRLITLRSPFLPGSGGYRVLVDVARVRAVLDRLDPDCLEVSDKSTLCGLGTWARRRGRRAVVISHERIDAQLAARAAGWLPTRRLSARWARSLAVRFDAVVCASRYAQEEFDRVGVTNTMRVPLGVDLNTFAPHRHSPALRRALAQHSAVVLGVVGRLSAEKRPKLAIDTLRVMRRRGIDARLVVVGTGPLRPALMRRAEDLPVTFLGHIGDRGHVAELLASLDVVLATGPVETFGLAALEALACGTAVVTPRTGALPELLDGPASGRTAWAHPSSFAAEVVDLLDVKEPERAAQARAAAQRLGWDRTVEAMLDLYMGLSDGGPHIQGMPVAGVSPESPRSTTDPVRTD